MAFLSPAIAASRFPRPARAFLELPLRYGLHSIAVKQHVVHPQMALRILLPTHNDTVLTRPYLVVRRHCEVAWVSGFTGLRVGRWGVGGGGSGSKR